MPFESKAQAKWMFANNPEMAREWASKTKSIKKLPVRKNNTPVWDKPDPTKSEKHLSQKKENKARARARAAGRPYPNLVDNMAVSKGLPSAFKGKVVDVGIQRNLPKSFQSKAEAHAKGKAISRRISSGYYKRLRNGDKHLRSDIGSARMTSSAASNPDRIAFGNKGAFESSFSGKKAELYREERLSRMNVQKSRTFFGQYKPISTFNKKELELHRAKYLPEKYSHPVVIDDKFPWSGIYWPQTKARKGENYRKNISKFDTPAWTRSEGKNPNGGLNAKGRASAKAEGHNLKPPVKSGNNPRRKSFLARMGNMPGPERKPNGEPTRLLLSLQAWGASSKADARKKAASMAIKKSWEVVSKVFPQPAIYREGSRNTRVMVHYDHSPTHWGIIHPHRGQEVAPKTHITFVKRKGAAKKVAKPVVQKPEEPDLDLFGEPLRKSMEYSVVMNSVNKGLPSAGRAIQAAKNKGMYQTSRMTPLRYRIFANDYGRMTAKREAEFFNRSPYESLQAATYLANETKQSGKRTKKYYKELLEREAKTRPSSSFKESGVGKSMNQSRFGGASAVGKAYVEKTDKTHFADKLLTNVERLTQEIKSHNASAYRKGIRHGARHNAKILVPAGAVGGSAVTATGMTIHQRRKREPINVHVVKDDAPMYDQMGQPVERKKSRNPLANMSGNAKLGTAGGAIGLAGVQRMAMAGTLPGKLKAQADAANARVKFQEDFAHSQNQRVQDATKIRNPLTRRRQVNMHTYYADKAADHLASAEGKKIMADNALKAASAKRAAHLKSGAGLVATGATLGGLAAYNNAKERKMRGKTK